MDKALKATESVAPACSAMRSVRTLGMVDHDGDGGWPWGTNNPERHCTSHFTAVIDSKPGGIAASTIPVETLSIVRCKL